MDQFFENIFVLITEVKTIIAIIFLLSLPLCVIGMLCCNSNNEFNEKSDTSLSDEESEVLDFLTEVEMNYIKNF